jgi:alkylhydroperoxidase family enzyme
MTAREACAIETNPAEVVLGDDQVQQLVRLASRFTARPLEFTPAEIDELARAAGSEEAFLEVAGVIAGFSFITRMADGLGVDPEIPTWVRRPRAMRRLTSRLMALGLRGAMDLRPRRYPGEQAEQDLRLLGEFHQQLGLGPLPGFFLRLRKTPHLLWSEREFFEAITEVHGARPGRFMAAGRIVLEEVSRSNLLSRIDDWLDRNGSEPPERLLAAAKAKDDGSGSLESEMLRFARDMTLRASSPTRERVASLTRERVEKLRSYGLTDEEILDWAFAIALWNAIGCTERLLEGEPDRSRAPGACSLPRTSHA